jgi:ferredoxin
MADKTLKNNKNVSGAFYIDEQCIDCDLCRSTAPDNFTTEDDLGYAYVCLQPRNQHETELCAEAMENCPVEAIGNDGDSN